MKTILYTAHIGNYDIIEPPKYLAINQDVHLILFTTDKNFKSDIWDVRYVDRPEDIDPDPQRVARYFKLQPHKVLPPHDINIWFDSCLSLKIVQYKKFVDENLLNRGLDMVAYNHPRRVCLYDEADACMSQGLDNGITIKRQMKRYRKEIFPVRFGLYDTGILIRRNTPEMIKFQDLWFEELRTGSKRDQLSHSYALWKTGIRISSFIKGTSKGHSPYLKKRKHLFSRRKNKNQATSSPRTVGREQAVLNKKIAYQMRMRRK